MRLLCQENFLKFHEVGAKWFFWFEILVFISPEWRNNKEINNLLYPSFLWAFFKKKKKKKKRTGINRSEKVFQEIVNIINWEYGIRTGSGGL